MDWSEAGLVGEHPSGAAGMVEDAGMAIELGRLSTMDEEVIGPSTRLPR